MADDTESVASSRFCQVPWSAVVVGLVCLLIGSLVLVPFGTTCTDTAVAPLPPLGAAEPGPPAQQQVCSGQTLLQSEGLATIVWIAVPSLAVALFPVVVRHRLAPTITVGLFSVLTFLGMFTIGILVLPIALTAWFAAACRLSATSRSIP